MGLDDRDYARREPPPWAWSLLLALQRLAVWSLLLFRWRGVAVRLHITFAIFAGLQLVSGLLQGPADLLMMLIWLLVLWGSVLAHEFGHVFACKAVGGQADDILLWPLGGLAFCAPPANPWAEFCTVVWGPLVNVIIAATTLLLAMSLGMNAAINPFSQPSWFNLPPGTFTSTPGLSIFLADLLQTVYRVNVSLLLFNLLLLFYPFDGGRLVQIGLWTRIGHRPSLLWSTTLGMAAAGGLFLFSLFNSQAAAPLVPDRFNFLALIAVFGFIECYRQRQHLLAGGGLGGFAEASYELSPERGAQVRRGAQVGVIGRWRAQRAADRERREREQIARLQAEVDRILAKVHQEGLASLTRAERQTLADATERERQLRQ